MWRAAGVPHFQSDIECNSITLFGHLINVRLPSQAFSFSYCFRHFTRTLCEMPKFICDTILCLLSCHFHNISNEVEKKNHLHSIIITFNTKRIISVSKFLTLVFTLNEQTNKQTSKSQCTLPMYVRLHDARNQFRCIQFYSSTLQKTLNIRLDVLCCQHEMKAQPIFSRRRNHRIKAHFINCL